MAVTELVYFTVNGFYIDAGQPQLTGDSNAPRLGYVNGLVDFIPRVPLGFTVKVAGLTTQIDGKTEKADTAIALANITARLHLGHVSTIDPTDTKGIRLVANSSEVKEQLTAARAKFPHVWRELSYDEDDDRLIYDVKFREVTYAGAQQVIDPFAFVAPQDDSPINLTDPTLEHLIFGGRQ